MATKDFVAGFVTSLLTDPDAVAALTARISSRTEDPQTIDGLIRYARERQASSGHALVRRLLTNAGVSWEAL